MKLVEDNLRLVHWVVRRKFHAWPHLYDDLVSAGYVGLMRAASSYDSDKAKFSVYAVKLITQACSSELAVLKGAVSISRSSQSYARRRGRYEKEVKAAQTAPSQIPEDRQARQPDVVDVIAAREALEHVNTLIDNSKHADTIREVLFDGVTCQEIADREGVTRMAISLRVRRCLGLA